MNNGELVQTYNMLEDNEYTDNVLILENIFINIFIMNINSK